MESSCKSQEQDPAPVTKKPKKLNNIKLLSLTYYNYNILRVAFTLKLYIGVDFINKRSFSVYLLFCTRIT